MTRIRSFGILAALAILSACDRIDETEHCVGTQYGNVTEQKAPKGLNASVFTDYTCFPLTEQNYPATEEGKEVIEDIPTRDSTLVSLDLAMTYQHDPATVYNDVFLPKHTNEKVMFEIMNALRDGARSAVASQTTESLIGPQRAVFDSIVKLHVQRKLGKIANVNKIFIRNIGLPKSLKDSRERIVTQATALREAQNTLQIAEAKAAASIAEAKGQAESRRLLAMSMSQAPRAMDLEIAKAYAGICAHAATCILGSSALEAFMTRKP